MHLHLAAITVFAVVLLEQIVDLQGADIIDVSKRFRYSLFKNWRRAISHPTMESLLALPSSIKLEVVNTKELVQGVTRRRYRELYKGREVMATSVEANVDARGHYGSGVVTGKLALSLQEDIPDKCTLTRPEATEIVFENEGLDAGTEIQSKSIVEKIDLQGSKAHLVYVVDILVTKADGSLSKPHYVIDCVDGKVLRHFENLVSWFSSPSVPYETATWDSVTGDWVTGDWVTWDYTGSTDVFTSPSPQTPGTSSVTGSSDATSDSSTTNPPVTTPDPSVTTPNRPVTTPSITTQPQSQGCSLSLGDVIGGNEKLGKLNYGTAPYCLELTQDGDRCMLENQYVKVINMEETKDKSRDQAEEFVCSEGISDVKNGAYNPSIDALFYGTAAFKVLKEWYDITPLDFKPNILVHYGKNFENAFWDGTNMAFGDGQDYFYPLVSLNVVAHELAHGFTGANSKLEYQQQSGGIDEAFADMTGEVVELYVRQNNDWKVGFNIVKDRNGALRYMDNPPKDGVSIDNMANYNDGMDVHYSSGVFNKVLHDVVEKGKVPLRYAFESFVLANSLYWVSTTGFEDGLCGTLRGAIDAGVDIQQYIDAFGAAGVKKDCKINTILEHLSTTKERTKVKVSSIRQPLFAVKTRADTTRFSVSATSESGTTVKIVLMRSLKRSPNQRVVDNKLETSAEKNTRYYVRLLTESAEEVNDVKVKLELMSA